MNGQRKDPLKNGADVLSSAISAKNTVSSYKRFAAFIQNTFFGGLSTPVITGLTALISLLMIMCLLISAVNPSSLFSSSETSIKDICNALNDGYSKARLKAREDIASFLNSRYGCHGDTDSFSALIANSFTYATEACEITVEFEPDLSEFAQHIDAHANAVNSTLQFFRQGDSDSLTENEKDVEEPLLSMDENGSLKLNEYGSGLISSYDSEYAANQSKAYFRTLQNYAEDIFDHERDSAIWTLSGFHKGTKEREVTVCYKRVRQIDMTYKNEKVACSLNHDIEKQETETVEVQLGTLGIPMTYDVSRYKKEAIEKTRQDLIGQEMYLAVSDDEYGKQMIDDYDQAFMIVENVISDYELSYLVSRIGGSYGYGYSGMITSNGFNYSFESDNAATTALFWAYSGTLNAILHDLRYRKGGPGSGPNMNHQCTQFAATFFYDVYGFAALRGNGNMQADNLLKDCGRGGRCPVEFERSTGPAPGAIISLYPNHVIVIDQVDDDGTVYISEGNYNGKGAVRTHQSYSSLSAYTKKTGYTIKTIAIPIQ